MSQSLTLSFEPSEYPGEVEGIVLGNSWEPYTDDMAPLLIKSDLIKNPTSVDDEVELLDIIFRAALTYNSEVADLLCRSLGVRNFSWDIKFYANGIAHIFSCEAISEWRRLRDDDDDDE